MIVVTADPPARRPYTRVRTIRGGGSARVGPLWDRCARLAAARGESMTDLVVRALEREEARLLQGHADIAALLDPALDPVLNPKGPTTP